MKLIAALETALSELLPDDDRPIVVFSAAWPFLWQMRGDGGGTVDDLLDVIARAAGSRTLLMPTFTRGYVDGVCNLDEEPGTTGILTELFRNRPSTKRTLSAFFSYGVSGPDADALVRLTPEHAWGDGSVYHWMEQRDVCFLMFGTDPTHCSWLHRLEWLCRDRIDYRYNKVFSGTLIAGGVARPFQESLYVRRLDPPVINDFTVLMPHLVKAGMTTRLVGGVSVATYSAAPVLDEVLPILRADPYYTVKRT